MTNDGCGLAESGLDYSGVGYSTKIDLCAQVSGCDACGHKRPSATPLPASKVSSNMLVRAKEVRLGKRDSSTQVFQEIMSNSGALLDSPGVRSSFGMEH